MIKEIHKTVVSLTRRVLTRKFTSGQTKRTSEKLQIPKSYISYSTVSMLNVKVQISAIRKILNKYGLF